MDHDDGAALVDGHVGELFCDLILEYLDTLEEEIVLVAETDILLFEEPPWQASHFPLGTYVGAGSEDDVETFALGDLAEGTDVEVA